MKKNFTVSLEQEKVEELQAYLNTYGLSLSGFFNGLLDESIMRCKEVSSLMEDEKLPFNLARIQMIKNKMYPSVMVF
ncbi:MAG: hypothetical protein Q8T08_21750 [Ignavibacteria bacterium]|nr:hypothetical protein [Ignavibacteria bacterium]